MTTVDLLSDEGYRCDGRRANELRKLTCGVGVFAQPDGSSFIEMGNTKVLCAVYGPHEVKNVRQKTSHQRALINCEYKMSTFSTGERKARSRGDYRSTEINTGLREIFETAILSELYPNSQIDIYLQVLQSDGSNFAACVNAATLALIHAGIPVKDVVVACSAGYIADTPVMDINYAEESLGSVPVLTIAMLPQSKQILSMESTGRIHTDTVQKVMDSAIAGCQQVIMVLKATISDYIKEMKP